LHARSANAASASRLIGQVVECRAGNRIARHLAIADLAATGAAACGSVFFNPDFALEQDWINSRDHCQRGESLP
jgi:hypothetical protein